MDRLEEIARELSAEMVHYRNDPESCVKNETWLLNVAEIVAKLCDWADAPIEEGGGDLL